MSSKEAGITAQLPPQIGALLETEHVDSLASLPFRCRFPPVRGLRSRSRRPFDFLERSSNYATSQNTDPSLLEAVDCRFRLGGAALLTEVV